MADEPSTKSTKSDKSDSPKGKSGGAPETSGELVTGEDAYKTGWLGSRNNAHADEEFALTSGPESPGAHDDDE